MTLDKFNERFLGKICTILTTSVNMSFKDAVSHAQYFTGEVIEFDDLGVWLRHPQIKTMSYFLLTNIVAIVEEQHIASNDPKAEEIREKFKTLNSPINKPPTIQPTGSFIPVDELTRKIKK